MSLFAGTFLKEKKYWDEKNYWDIFLRENQNRKVRSSDRLIGSIFSTMEPFFSSLLKEGARGHFPEQRLVVKLHPLARLSFFYLPPFVTNFSQLPFVNRDVVYHYHDSVPNVAQTSLILTSSPPVLCGYIGLYFGFKRFYQGFEMYPMHLKENIISNLYNSLYIPI